MSDFFDWNPDRGTWYEHDFDEQTGKTIITTKQDVQPVIDAAKRKRDSGYVDRGIKKGWWHYASIPAHVEIDLKKRGISIYDQNQTNELLKIIDSEYPYLKNTYKKHRVSH